jgi:hypothetical protein
VSSTEAVKVVRFDPAVPEAGGAVEKTTLDGAAAAITVATVEVAVVIERELSVAVKV